jgi:hypothetical protein
MLPADYSRLTRTVNTQPIAAIRKYLAPELRNRCLRKAFSSTNFLDELDGDLVEELQRSLPENHIVSLLSEHQ